MSCDGSAPPISSARSAAATSAHQLVAAPTESTPSSSIIRRWFRARALDAADILDDLADDAETRFAGTLRDLRLAAARAADGRTGVRAYQDGAWVKLTSAAPLPARIVLLVHGLDEPGTIWDDLTPALDGAGVTVVRFDYPNDERIARSARRLIAALESLKTLGVARVDIVAHSMGGLVARDALTRDDAYAGECDQPDDALFPDIHRLIMVGAPNYGSLMARLRPLAEIREQLVRYAHAGIAKPGTLLGFLTDGAGEAGEDVAVGSRFLNDLNARPTLRHVMITCIVGELEPAQSDHLLNMLKTPFTQRVLGARADQLARDLRAAMLELGDGVVSVSSAQLQGVTDIVRVHANHRTMLLTLGAERLLTPITGAPPADPPAIRVILDRLSKD